MASAILPRAAIERRQSAYQLAALGGLVARARTRSNGLTNRRMRARMSGGVRGGGATPPLLDSKMTGQLGNAGRWGGRLRLASGLRQFAVEPDLAEVTGGIQWCERCLGARDAGHAFAEEPVAPEEPGRSIP